jgi:hypothetical protein
MARLRKFPNNGGFRAEVSLPSGVPVYCPDFAEPDEALYAAQVLHRRLHLGPPDYGEGLSPGRRAVVEMAVARLIEEKRLSG